jgi:hypothetical protein
MVPNGRKLTVPGFLVQKTAHSIGDLSGSGDQHWVHANSIAFRKIFNKRATLRSTALVLPSLDHKIFSKTEHGRSVYYFRTALDAKRQFSKTRPLVDCLSTSPEDLRKKSLLPDYGRPIKRHAIAVDSSQSHKVFTRLTRGDWDEHLKLPHKPSGIAQGETPTNSSDQPILGLTS